MLERPFLRRSEFFTPRILRLLLQLKAYRSVKGLAARYFRSEELQDAFSLQSLYIGGAPFQSPSLYTLLPYAEHAFGVWYWKGGYAALSALLAEELEKQGVTVRLNTPVREILREGKRCTGVKLHDGRTAEHEAIVYNGDFPHLPSLLPGFEASRRKFTPSGGNVLVYLGVNKRWPQAKAHQFFLPKSLTAGLKQSFLERLLPDDPSFYIFNPVAVDSGAAAETDSVLYLLSPVPSTGTVNWEKEKEAYVDRLLTEAERRGFPGLKEAIRWIDVRTPDDAERDGLFQGGSFGIAPTLLQSGAFRPQFVPYPSLANLYAVGASIHPGGGIPIVMQGARLLAHHMTKEMALWKSEPAWQPAKP
ncbi:FAD-dependent oxidoreductase [Paenibacillus sp. CC-CFT747]|nr:FAD-dependent oxidoreductase [Paenibacillus sp. CC-CFT747]